MKKLSFLCVVLVISASLSYGQTEKGSVYSGPGFTTYYSKTSYKSGNSSANYKEWSQNAGVAAYFDIGYFVANNLAIGPGFDVGYSWNKNTAGDYYFKSQNLYFGFDPFARYYFGGSNKLKPFAQANAGVRFELGYIEYSSGTNNETIAKYQTQYLTLDAGAAVGVAYFINQVIGLECSVSYNYAHNVQSSNMSGSSDVDYKTNNHRLNLGIGLQYYFAKTKKEK